MGKDYKAGRHRGAAPGPSRSESSTPGKRTLTENLPVQYKAVQRKAATAGEGSVDADPVAHGFSGPSSSVPYADQMNRSFGTDFGAVRAYRGPAAQEACDALGAEAFTSS